MEIWRSVVGYQGLYEVSNYGQVRSLGRVLSPSAKPGQKGGRRSARSRMLRITKARYCMVCLSKDGKHRTRLVHGLVLEAFVGPCPEGMICRHFPDRDTTNNHQDNLSWGTPTQNQLDRVFHGTGNIGRGKPRKTTPEMDEMIRSEYSTGEGITRYGHGKTTQRKLAEKWNLCLATINVILHDHRKGKI